MSEPSISLSQVAVPSPAGRIFELLPKVAGAVGAISKGRTAKVETSSGKNYTYQFRGIDDFYNALHPALVQWGVSMSHTWTLLTDTGSGRGTRVTVLLTTRFYADDASFIETQAIGEGQDFGDKAMAKAMSNALKYMLMSTFSVPTEGVQDPDLDDTEINVRGGDVQPPRRSRNQGNGAARQRDAADRQKTATDKQAPQQAPKIKPSEEAETVVRLLRECDTVEDMDRIVSESGLGSWPDGPDLQLCRAVYRRCQAAIRDVGEQ